MRRIVPALAALLMLALPGCDLQSSPTTASTTSTSTTEAPPPTLPDEDHRAVVDLSGRLLDAWAAGDLDTVREISPGAGPGLEERHAAWTEGLSLQDAGFEVVSARPSGEGAEASYRAVLDLGAAGTWEYEGTVSLTRAGEEWEIPWSAGIVHPALEEGDLLVLDRQWPERGAILGNRGITLVTDRAIKAIGVIPEQVEDLDELLQALEEHAGIPRAVARRELNRPSVRPDWWVPVGWLPLVDYLPVQSQLEAVAGLEMRDDTARLAPAGPFADHVLGTTGPITAEMLDLLGDPYRAGDVVGLSGLEREMEEQLSGYPTFEVRRANRFGRVVEVLHTVPGVTPTPVRTTLSVDVQVAAEAALADVDLPAALVAVDVGTGEIRAITSRPAGGFDRAAAGRYPPGSTFKVITAYGLLGAGMTRDGTVECPAAVEVGGREFTNAGGFDLGEVTLETALVRSCNTTFAELGAAVLGSAGLRDAAAAFGYGAEYSIATGSADPSLPAPPEPADVAAAAIGQGATLVTPLHQATVAAAVASGAWRAPTLLGGAETADPRPLDTTLTTQLLEMMRAVVAEGTGTAAAVAGEDVAGKTGSAEWSDTEPTHAWFIGTWEGLGFAVVVETGGAGGSAAAPIAAEFVAALAG